MKSEPLLSICIPTYNRAEIVMACVEQCLKIPVDWIEIVVTDNCSTDNTMELLSTVDDSRFKLYRNESNIGYENLTKCLTNGNGKFCLLLSDEDEFFDTDWESVREQLEKDQTTAAYQFNYENEEGHKLLDLSVESHKANTFGAFKRGYTSFAYAGGMIIRRDTLKHCWEEAIRKPLLWKLYSERVIPIYCFKYGDYSILHDINVHRTERNNTGKLDTGAWCGGMNEPYWSIRSRIVQFHEWVELFSEFDVEKRIREKLAIQVVYDSIKSTCVYYNILNADSDQPLFKKYSELIERDRKEYSHKWIINTHKIYKSIRGVFKDNFTSYNKVEYTKQVTLSFCRTYFFFFKKWIKKMMKRN